MGEEDIRSLLASDESTDFDLRSLYEANEQNKQIWQGSVAERQLSAEERITRVREHLKRCGFGRTYKGDS